MVGTVTFECSLPSCTALLAPLFIREVGAMKQIDNWCTNGEMIVINWNLEQCFFLTEIQFCDNGRCKNRLTCFSPLCLHRAGWQSFPTLFKILRKEHRNVRILLQALFMIFRQSSLDIPWFKFQYWASHRGVYLASCFPGWYRFF